MNIILDTILVKRCGEEESKSFQKYIEILQGYGLIYLIPIKCSL